MNVDRRRCAYQHGTDIELLEQHRPGDNLDYCNGNARFALRHGVIS
jgi:hypothetical protein